MGNANFARAPNYNIRNKPAQLQQKPQGKKKKLPAYRKPPRVLGGNLPPSPPNPPDIGLQFLPQPGQPVGTPTGPPPTPISPQPSPLPDAQPTTAPPPTLPEQEAARQAALAEETSAISQANQARYAAALRYGDPTLIARIAGETGGLAVADNPTSDLSTIARNEQQGLTDVGESANQGNTFFSGIHLRNRGKVGEQAGFQRADALTRYRSAEDDLTNQIAAAHRARKAAFDNALAQEIQAVMNQEPEPTGDIPAEPAGGGGGGDEGGGGGGSGGGHKKKAPKKKGDQKKPEKKKQKPKITGHGIGTESPGSYNKPAPKKKGKK